MNTYYVLDRKRKGSGYVQIVSSIWVSDFLLLVYIDKYIYIGQCLEYVVMWFLIKEMIKMVLLREFQSREKDRVLHKCQQWTTDTQEKHATILRTTLKVKRKYTNNY